MATVATTSPVLPSTSHPDLFEGVSSIQISISSVPEEFGWADFPILTHRLEYPPLSSSFKTTTSNHVTLYDDETKQCGDSDNDDEHEVEYFYASVASTSALSPSKKMKMVPSTTSVKKQRRNQTFKQVQFDAVHIRDHCITIGDHDWCEGNLPITLDWSHSNQIRTIPMDEYEEIREKQGRTPRGQLPKLEYWQRKQLLQTVGGFSEQDLEYIESMDQGKEPSKYVQLRRSKTVTNFPETIPEESSDEDVEEESDQESLS